MIAITAQAMPNDLGRVEFIRVQVIDMEFRARSAIFGGGALGRFELAAVGAPFRRHVCIPSP